MAKRFFCMSVIIILMFLCACRKNETETIGQEEAASEPVSGTVSEPISGTVSEPISGTVSEPESETITETVETEEAKTSIHVENPSWDYYTSNNVQSGTRPYELKLLVQNTNEIIDTDAWFTRNNLTLQKDNTEEEYYGVVEGNGILVNIYKGDSWIAGLDFSDYMYSDDYVEEDVAYIEETVHDARIRDGILYVSTFHYTYAESAPSNAYITAINLDDYSVIWKSEPLVCNSLNFEIVDDVIFCGYGFTSEPDYLYQIDRITGCILAKQELKSKPDYIIYKDGKLYVRTYNTDYVFEVEKQE